MAGRATAPLQSSSAAAAEVNGTEADLHGIAEDATGLTLAKPTRNPSNGRKRDKPDESTTSWRGSSGGASPGPSQPTSQPRSKRGRTPLRGSSPAVQSSQEPGGKSAYEQWLEENQQVVEEAPLIEELQEEAPHEPTSEELASDAAFAEFAALLPGLTPAKDSISDATSAALRAAAAGAGLRAVRAVVDAVAECPDSRQRLPHLYLLDSIVKREARQAKEEGSEGDGAAPVVFPRAVGAALPRLMNLLLGDDYVEAKLQKILTIWRAQGLVTEGLVDAAMETMVAHAAHVAAEAAAAAAKEEEQAALSEEELLDLMRATPMDAKLTLRYTMPDGSVQTVVIPRHQPRDEDDWSTPEELGLVRPSAPSLLHLAKGNPRDSTPTKATAQRPMSPWRLQEQIINTPGAWLNSQPPLPPGPPPPPMQPRPPPAAPAAADPGEELDEFDQGLLRDAVGGVGIVAPGAAPSGAGIKPVLAPPLPQHQTSLAPSAAMIPPSGAPAKDGMVVHQPASAQTAPAGAPHNAAPVRPPPPPLPNAQMGWGGAVEGAPMVAQQMPGGLHPGVALAAHQQQQHMQQQYMMQMQAHAQMMQQQEAQMAMAQQQHMLGMGGPVPMQVYAGGPVAMHGFPQAPGQVYGIRPPMQPQPHLGPGRPPGPMGGMQNGGRMW